MDRFLFVNVYIYIYTNKVVNDHRLNSETVRPSVERGQNDSKRINKAIN